MRCSTIFFSITILVFSTNLLAHGGQDPKHELSINAKQLTRSQRSFENISSEKDRLENIEEQVRHIEKSVLLLRNLMASEYPHVKENMSKYKMDYIKALDASMVALNRTLQQLGTTIEQKLEN